MSALDLVLGKLDGVRQHGGYWMARCPVHEDGNASLSKVGRAEQSSPSYSTAMPDATASLFLTLSESLPLTSAKAAR